MSAIFDYFVNNGQTYLRLLGGHIFISAVSVLAAMAVAIPLGTFCARSVRLQAISEAFFGFLRIVPSLAVLILLDFIVEVVRRHGDDQDPGRDEDRRCDHSNQLLGFVVFEQFLQSLYSLLLYLFFFIRT